MTLREGDDCLALPGFFGGPHCQGPVDARHAVHMAVSDFADFLLVSIRRAPKNSPREIEELLTRIADDLHETTWMYLEPAFPFNFLAPFWDYGDATEPPRRFARSEQERGGQPADAPAAKEPPQAEAPAEADAAPK